MLAALRHTRSPPLPREERAPPQPTSGRKPEGVTGCAGHAEDDDEDDDVESLLYLAQMDLIAHKPEQATVKLQHAVDLGSSAACATLANLLARGWRAETARPALSSPPLVGPSPPATSPPASHPPPHAYRPRPPLRQSSSVAALSAPRRTAASQRAVGLFCTGLEVELRKPVRRDGADAKRDEEDPVESGYGSGEDDDGAEGRFFSLERALDLVVGVTDAHRFGVLHAPHTQHIGQLPSPTDPEGETNDLLWRRSSKVASELLAHEAVAPVLHAIPAQIEQRPSQRRRPSSAVSRSYTHPSATLIASPTSSSTDSQSASLFSPKRKLQLTIAIHALYTLAVQSYASSSSSFSSSPSCSLDAENHWSTIVSLAQPYSSLGGIGIKEADELVERAQRRLESLRHQDMGAQEPWRLAKRKGKGKERQVEEEGEGVLGTSAVTIRPASVRSNTTVGSFGGRTPRVGSAAAKFHFHGEVEEGDEEAVSPAPTPIAAIPSGLPAADLAHSPPFALSPPKDSLVSPVHSNHSSAPSSNEEAALQYPSPPDTPPTELPAQLQPFSPPQPEPTPGPSTTSSLSPPLSSASALAPLYPPDRSHSPSSSSALPRVTSTRSIRSTHSILSNLKHDPLQSYLDLRLKRVTSAASICTAPPDFSERSRRLGGKGKGKGRMVEPEQVEGFALASNGRLRTRASSNAPAPEPKTWLSRFWSTTKNLKDRPAAAPTEEGTSDLDRTRSSSAVHELRKALRRHEEASEVMYSYWGETEFVEDEEVDGADQREEQVVPASKVDSPAIPPQASTSGTTGAVESAQATRLRQSLAEAVDAAPRQRTVSSKRSFALNDPTASLDPSPSRRSSHDRDRSSSRRRRHARQHSGSSATSTATTIDGFLAPPSPITRHRRRKSEPRPLKPVAMDPLLLELEKRSRVGVQTVCAACGKRGLNFPACRKCKRTYCGRTCRIGQKHACSQSPPTTPEKAKGTA
ncbi:hypothetical protein NBRC10513v2_007333 [Rhodotorula toruloides]|uniref:Proteophosphoglycan ppg4 n=1 Tax=Rhodotorula toruloides TaxID=5286 RepID=A0A2S9ZYA9_RHOTO|nr:Proteophosphoglycan ppg4 [Rhodotorula toruloides]